MRAMILEGLAGQLGKAVISRIGKEVTGKLLERQQNQAALERALKAALRVTDQRHREVLGRYDVNVGFFEHEGADEIARVLLPGRGPDARRMARAYVGSLGGGQGALLSDPLVEPFETFRESLSEELGKHKPFRIALAEVAATRSSAGAADEVDEREYLEWVGDRFAFLKTTGIGTTQHVQLPLSEVFVQPTGLREQTAGVKWSTRAEEQRALLDERLRNREISHAEFEALLDRLGLVEAARERTEPEPIAVNDLIRTVDYAVVLGDPGTGKTTLLRYLALRHAQALLNGVSMASAELGPVRLPLYVRAGDFARSSRREDGLRAFIAPFLSATLQCPVDCQRLDALVARALR